MRITTGNPSIALNRPAKSERCIGSSFCSALRRDLLVARQNHRLHERQTIFREEHVLGAAEADALRAELPRDFGIARDIGIGAHAELAAELIGPAHELADVIVAEIRARSDFAWPR